MSRGAPSLTTWYDGAWGRVLDEVEYAEWIKRRPWVVRIAQGWHAYIDRYGADHPLIRLICAADAGTDAHLQRIKSCVHDDGLELVDGSDQDGFTYSLLVALAESSPGQLLRHAESCRLWVNADLGITVCGRSRRSFNCARPEGHSGRCSITWTDWPDKKPRQSRGGGRGTIPSTMPHRAG